MNDDATPAKVRLTDGLGAVLTYEDQGGPGAHGQTPNAADQARP